MFEGVGQKSSGYREFTREEHETLKKGPAGKKKNVEKVLSYYKDKLTNADRKEANARNSRNETKEEEAANIRRDVEKKYYSVGTYLQYVSNKKVNSSVYDRVVDGRRYVEEYLNHI